MDQPVLRGLGKAILVVFVAFLVISAVGQLFREPDDHLDMRPPVVGTDGLGPTMPVLHATPLPADYSFLPVPAMRQD